MRTELRAPRTIVFPIDLSPHYKSAASLVSLLFQRFGSRVIVLYTLEPVDHPFETLYSGSLHETRSRKELAREQAAEFIKREFPAFPFDLRIEEGTPAEVIVRVAEETDADLICLPTRGHGLFRRFLLGSVAAKVLNDAQVPVLTGVHLEQPADREELEIGSVVCALSLDERGEAALRAAFLLRDVFRAKLTVVHALEQKGVARREEARSAIARLVEPARDPVDVVIEECDPAQLVSRSAADSKADVVVIGRSTPGPLGRLRAQSYAIVRESPCPVLSV